jgi:hypothetical protein
VQLKHKPKKEIMKTKRNGVAKALYTQTWVIKNSHTFTNCICNRNTSSWRAVSEGQLNVVKLRMFRVGKRMPTVSKTEGQYLMPIKRFIENKASMWRRLICSVCKFYFSNILS